MMVDSEGYIAPQMLQDVNHHHYTEAETFYGLVELLPHSGPSGLSSAVHATGIIVLQLVYSTLGPWPSCQISGRFTFGGVQKTISVNKQLRYYRSANTPAMTVACVEGSSDGFQLAIRKNFALNTIAVDLRCPQEDISCSLMLYNAMEGYAFNGGKTYYYAPHSLAPGFVSSSPPIAATNGMRQLADGYVLEHFLPIMRFMGQVQTSDGLVLIQSDHRAAGLFTHAVQAIKPYHAASRWNVFLMHDRRNNSLLHMVRWKTPPQFGLVEIYQGAFMQDGKVLALCGGSDNSIVDMGVMFDPVSGYAVPHAIHHHWQAIGHGDAKSFQAESQVTLHHLLGRHDVLEKLPSWLRFIIRNFISSPFMSVLMHLTIAR